MFEKLEGIIKSVCQKNDVGLYDIDIHNVRNGKVLCVYITKVNGVSIADCSTVAKEINRLIDGDPSLIDNLFTIEVSSPGLERVLKLKRHYTSSINEILKISYLKENTKEIIIGKLLEVNPNHIIIERIERTDERISIPFQSIKKAKTFYQLCKSDCKNNNVVTVGQINTVQEDK